MTVRSPGVIYKEEEHEWPKYTALKGISERTGAMCDNFPSTITLWFLEIIPNPTKSRPTGAIVLSFVK